MAQRSIMITYDIHPPTTPTSPQIPADLAKSKTHTFPLAASPSEPEPAADASTTTQSHKSYYNQLEKALADARNVVGDELTKWRDLVGKAELSKETKKSLKYGEEEEEEEDE
ncbi:hypothetical protein BDN72DRAFT_819339 [Pluteus cervinus]|uniref:Uncharacterized protein n=1 Tax=Pluteus cervinus TaxID=181527 RepID=A0ACD3AXR8_9AGAR|nr:hypothetical protein BDN72DRAFT_819339 [Pluteus cervinus]